LDRDEKFIGSEGIRTNSGEQLLFGCSGGREAPADSRDAILPNPNESEYETETALEESNDGTLERVDDEGLVRSASTLKVSRAMRD